MLYIVAMLQPIMPLIEYNLNKEYIVSVLCENRNKPELACNGKCYLNKKLQKSTNKSHDHPVPQIDLSKYPISLIEEEYKSSIKEIKIVSKKNYFQITKLPTKYHSTLFKPPIS